MRKAKRMKKRLMGLVIILALVGCENNVVDKDNVGNGNSAEDLVQSHTSEEGDFMIKADYGTVKEVSESNVIIEGVGVSSKKIYMGNPSGFEEVYPGEFVYLEFSDYEETEGGYNVKFTILREENRKLKVPRE